MFVKKKSMADRICTLFVYAKIWLILMHMLKCYESKTLFHGQLKRTGCWLQRDIEVTSAPLRELCSTIMQVLAPLAYG